jgi:hypothetical protein
VNGDRPENCLYLYGKSMVEQSGPGQSEVRGRVGVVGVKRACSHGGGEYISLYEPFESLT